MEYYDPYIAEYKYKGVKRQGLKQLRKDMLREYDIVVITTAHTNIDYHMIAENAQVVFDTKTP